MPPLLSPPKPTFSDDRVRCCRNGVKSEPEPSGSSHSAAVLLARGLLGLRRVHHLPAAGLLGDRLAGARIHHVAGDLGHHLLQSVRAADVEPALARAVGVDVDRRLVTQLGGVLLGPLGRAEQPPFLAVPEREDDGALRAPSGLEQLGESASGLHQRHRAADRIVGAVHPRVVVVAEDDPLVREGRALDAHDDVVQRAVLPVEGQLDAHLRGTGADVIGHRQRAAPFLRRHRAPSSPSAAATRRRRRWACTGILRMVAESACASFFAPGSDAQPGLSGSPG